jgi:ketosteroid isomerase-like protein
MRILLVWLLSLTTSIVVSAQQNAGTRSGRAVAETEIVGVQDALIDAYVHRDTATLDRILADEYTFINDDAGGVVNKKQILDSFRSGGDREITSYIRQDDHVRWYGDVAVLTYRYHSNETYKGQDAGGDFRVTRIFVKREGRWQIVGGQETRVHQQPDFSAVTSNDEHILKQLEQDWLDAYRDGDAEKMGRILADDFVGRWGDGSTTDKRGTVEPVRTGAEKHSANQLVECKVRIYGDTAVVTGIQTEQSVLEGRDGSGTYSYTDIFVKRHGNWQIVASETKHVGGQSARERLIGSWKEIFSEETLPDGTVLQLDEVGLVTYDRSGHMSGQTMRRSEPKQRIPSDAIYQSNGYDAYFGTFTVDEVKHTVTHHVEGGVARHLVGKDLVRSYSFEGERLVLKPVNADEHWTVVLEKNRTYGD